MSDGAAHIQYRLGLEIRKTFLDPSRKGKAHIIGERSGLAMEIDVNGTIKLRSCEKVAVLGLGMIAAGLAVNIGMGVIVRNFQIGIQRQRTNCIIQSGCLFLQSGHLPLDTGAHGVIHHFLAGPHQRSPHIIKWLLIQSFTDFLAGFRRPTEFLLKLRYDLRMIENVVAWHHFLVKMYHEAAQKRLLR